MKFNHQLIHKYFKKFYNEILKINYTQSHVNEVESLITFIDNDPEWKDIRHIAYALASVIWETGAKIKPVEEILAKPGTRVYDLQAKYKPFTGKGQIQLTHRVNFEKMGKRLGLPLVQKPELALDREVSYKILSVGMREGLFSGKKLSDYISGNKVNYRGARAIVNGSDKADKIAYYAECMETILNTSLIKEEEIPQYIPIQNEFTIPEPIQEVEYNLPFTVDEGEQQEPISTTVTTKTETSTPTSSTTVEVEKNIPAPTQYIDAVIPRITSGLKAWKATLSGILGSLGLGGVYSWLSEKFQFIHEHSAFIIGSIIIAAIFGIAFLIFRFWLINQREKRANELTMAQLRIRSDPSLTNVEVTKPTYV